MRVAMDSSHRVRVGGGGSRGPESVLRVGMSVIEESGAWDASAW